MSIEIEGLSPLQQEIADRIWALETPEQITEFFCTMPRNLLHDALVVHQMMVWACRDSFEPDDYDLAQAVIEHIRDLPC